MNLSNSQDESSSCQRHKEHKELCIANSMNVAGYAKKKKLKDIGRFSGLDQFRGTSALERGTLKSKGGGKMSTHFCGDPQTVEVFFAVLFPSIS